MKRIEKFLIIIYHLYMIMIVFICFIILVSNKGCFEYQTAYCWVGARCPYIRLFGYFFWLFFTLIINIILIIAIFIIICTMPKEYRTNLFKSIAYKAISYSFIFVLGWLPATIMRMIQIINSNFENYYLNIVHLVLSKTCIIVFFLNFVIVEKIYILKYFCFLGLFKKFFKKNDFDDL
jgi:hypothetical protein